jgi:hypothetical protein
MQWQNLSQQCKVHFETKTDCIWAHGANHCTVQIFAKIAVTKAAVFATPSSSRRMQVVISMGTNPRPPSPMGGVGHVNNMTCTDIARMEYHPIRGMLN